jgi:hypothetical protein
LNDRSDRSFDDWSNRSFNDRGFNRCGFNNRCRSCIALIGGFLSRCLLGGLFFFNRSDFTHEAGSLGFALEHRYECFNQS